MGTDRREGEDRIKVLKEGKMNKDSEDISVLSTILSGMLTIKNLIMYFVMFYTIK